MTAGQAYGMLPVGLGARDTLRLEARYLLYGQDMDETTHPFEVGLGWITKLDSRLLRNYAQSCQTVPR